MKDSCLLGRLVKNMTDITTGKTSSLKVVYSFFGPPGTGKGTVAREAVEQLGFTMISTGEMLRAEVASNSDLGILVKETITRGALVSDEIVTKIVVNGLRKCQTTAFILDGYPRTASQARTFLDLFPKLFPGVELKVVHFNLTDEEICRRLSARLICKNKACQKTFSLISRKPKIDGICDHCADSLMRRSDDADAIVLERLEEYQKHALQVLAVYIEYKINISRLDLYGKNEEAVFSEFVLKCGT